MSTPSIEHLLVALRALWSADTSSLPTEWTLQNPARGQCVPSALVVQHYLGGDLCRYQVSGDGISETHYCNVLEDGTHLDTTVSQYAQVVTSTVCPVELKGFQSIREKRLADEETRQRYERLLGRVESIFFLKKG